MHTAWKCIRRLLHLEILDSHKQHSQFNVENSGKDTTWEMPIGYAYCMNPNDKLFYCIYQYSQNPWNSLDRLTNSSIVLLPVTLLFYLPLFHKFCRFTLHSAHIRSISHHISSTFSLPLSLALSQFPFAISILSDLSIVSLSPWRFH